ncbi:HlyD family secretion protein [Nitrosospira multiformis]|uniref:HlyD family secretion protein n=1 Tax=Nitrosospira multiformis TaxID=1231 RepID=A0A1I7H1M2_9PROT|nr:biotin/lipoyl-binding protein [Nitrosospira multiformis]SFU54583.1 HlyD family secretion protein [Nitrosospira multiformis]
MRNQILITIAALGILAGVVSAFLASQQKKPQPPVFNPAQNPYAKGIYSNGIIESYQSTGENINLYPEVAGVVTQIMVAEGQTVMQGQPLLKMDDSIQRATVEQQRSQAEAALALLEELKAQPRREVLDVSLAQLGYAAASLQTAETQLQKQQASYDLDPRSVSKDTLDNAINAVNAARANLEVASRNYQLTKAGAWSYDIRNQERQYAALSNTYQAGLALLQKYTIYAPADGVILSIGAAIGSYVSPQGIYGTYTSGMDPVLVMGKPENELAVRCYVDEILVHRLPDPSKMHAQMFIRGTKIRIPLEYVRVQPYVSPKIQLSNQRTERVDVRVLPVLFRFQKPKGIQLYPGQLVDVYIGEEANAGEKAFSGETQADATMKEKEQERTERKP